MPFFTKNLQQWQWVETVVLGKLQMRRSYTNISPNKHCYVFTSFYEMQLIQKHRRGSPADNRPSTD